MILADQTENANSDIFIIIIRDISLFLMGTPEHEPYS